MEQETRKDVVITTHLKNLISRIRLQSRDFADLTVRIYAAQVAGGNYVIELSKGRFSRRVEVDPRTLRGLQAGVVESHLSRELRSAMMAVAKRARDRQ